jgi:chlorobactene glucosyltransferase
VIVLFHCALILFIIGALAGMLINVAAFDGLTEAEPPADAPLVSALIPARNEAHNIERCVGSLVAQDWPRLEVIVLDDRSEDGTGDLARAIGGECLRVVEGSELPAGWVGKNWACHQLAQLARGQWLFFIDADTEHAPGTVSAAVSYASRTGADLLSAWPRLVTVGLGEKLVLPLIIFVGLVVYPHALVLWLQRHPHVAARLPRRVLRLLGAANGQFLFFRRESYDRIGGHAALRDHLVDDVTFGRMVAARIGEGMRLINCESLRFSKVRMYHSLAEVWEGFTKNSRAIFEDNPLNMAILGLVETVVFVGPFFFLFSPWAPRSMVLVEIGLIYLMRFILAWRFQTSWLGAVLHPFGLLLALAIGVNSWIRSSRGGVTWKGRRYTMSAPADGGR